MVKPKRFTNVGNIVSDEVFHVHYQLYQNYCDKYNLIQEELKEYTGCPDADKNYSRYRGMKRDETHNLNAVILHEEYFKGICDEQKQPQQIFKDAVSKHFGSFDGWLKDFKSASLATRGWCICAYEQRSKCIVNYIVDNHDFGVLIGAYSLITNDCWEHAYLPDYGNDIHAYVDNFIKHIDWDIVETKIMNVVG